jgi:hypothetical protein
VTGLYGEENGASRAASGDGAFAGGRWKLSPFLRSNRDGRHGLFIVGCGHSYKSTVPGLGSPWLRNYEGLAPGALLSARLPKGEVFSILTHIPATSNTGGIRNRIRKGAFNAAFRLNGDVPVAFNLNRGPFGQEPMDALQDIAYESKAGTFADNYDGYIFLGPLDQEPNGYILYELYSDAFAKELLRRAHLKRTTLKEMLGVDQADKESLINRLKKTFEGKKR